jgi:hypothetical protein
MHDVRAVVPLKTSANVVTLSILHPAPMPCPLNSVASRNVPSSDATLDTSHDDKTAAIALAPSNVLASVVTAVVVHVVIPCPWNFVASRNVPSSVATFDTSHDASTATISPAPSNVWASVVADVVVHFPRPVVVHVAALGLPFSTYDPPTAFRCVERA